MTMMMVMAMSMVMVMTGFCHIMAMVGVALVM